MLSSPILLAELADVLTRSKFRTILVCTHTSPENSLEEIRRLAEVIAPQPLAKPVCRDPDGDQVLALAKAAKADCIVSGDKGLLSLGSFQGIPIMAPAEAFARLA